MSESLLRHIGEYCRRARMAESTFGRLAVNDGKLVSRLRLGGRVRSDTVARVQAFIERNRSHPPLHGAGAIGIGGWGKPLRASAMRSVA
jgi:hypothetical protein